MRLLEIFRKRKNLSPPQGKWTTIHDPYPGAWQQDQPIELKTVLVFSAVYACIRLISADIGKMRMLMMRRTGRIWEEAESPLGAVLRKPNSYQTRVKFLEQWIISKLIHGNTFVLKERDMRGVVRALRVLDPLRCEPLVSDSGEVFYRVKKDRMTRTENDIVLPATEIIHDVHLTPEHPLIGVSPIAACGLTASQGMAIQRQSQAFFSNAARPGGILTAPGAISKDTAERLKEQFQQRYGGENAGKIAVAGDGLKFEALSIPASDAQLIEQLRWTSEDVCRAFGVPAYKVGVGTMPSYNNIGALNQAYYDDTLQELIEQIEVLLTEGLELPSQYRVALNLEQLLRMDAGARFESYEKAIGAGWKSPNEVRRLENLPDVEGGDAPYLQQQNYSLAALAQRDAQNPLSEPPPAPTQEQMSTNDARTFLRGFLNG